MRVGVITLGCPKNVVDSELMITQLLGEGFEVIRDLSELWEVDALVINTCGFLRSAIEELLDTAETVSELLGDKPVVVIGCAVNRLKDDPEGLLRALRERGLNVVALLGTGQLLEVGRHLMEALRSSRRVAQVDVSQPRYEGLRRTVLSSPFWAYLKIAEGCSHSCGFCTIPQIRGPYRSRSLEDLLSEARELADLGVRELILISQDTTAWGHDLYGKPMLPELLKELSRLPFRWIRLMYLMPTGLTDELIDLIGQLDNVLPYFDVPFQHISPAVLRAMRRAPLPELHYRLVERIRDIGGVIRATFIVGHPGEGERDFEELLEFIRWGRFERIGLFAYSPEPETYSYTLPQVPDEVKEERLIRATELASSILKSWMRERLGEEHEVLLEELAEARYGLAKARYGLVGRAWFDAPEVDGIVRVKGSPKLLGQIVRVKLKRYRALEATFWGEALC